MSASPQRTPPSVGELLARYLERTWEAGPATPGDVIPHDSAVAASIDPRLAWDGAVACLGTDSGEATSPPTDWPTLTGLVESMPSVAYAVGNFPQLLRGVHPLWESASLASLCPDASRPVGLSGLSEWAKQTSAKGLYPQILLAAGVLRLARAFDEAEHCLGQDEDQVPARWREAWLNERAALAWHRGHWADALRMWEEMPATAVVLFNRGMAYLFLDRPAEARTCLAEAVRLIPEPLSWHHLAKLYLAVAQMRG